MSRSNKSIEKDVEGYSVALSKRTKKERAELMKYGHTEFNPAGSKTAVVDTYNNVKAMIKYQLNIDNKENIRIYCIKHVQSALSSIQQVSHQVV